MEGALSSTNFQLLSSLHFSSVANEERLGVATRLGMQLRRAEVSSSTWRWGIGEGVIGQHARSCASLAISLARPSHSQDGSE